MTTPPQTTAMPPTNNNNTPSTIVQAALVILNTADPWEKASLTDTFVAAYNAGQLSLPSKRDLDHPTPPPDIPARASLTVLKPGQMKQRGKGGSPQSRIALLHSLCHIESWAVDLAWDIIARFGAHPDYAPHLPRAFFDDFVRVASDECRHMRLLAQRLVDLGSHYGALPVHDGLWESAMRTAHSLPARLAVEHCVHEARGLDVLPTTIRRFRSNEDQASAALLEDIIYPEEVTHCAAGVTWLTHLHRVGCELRENTDDGGLRENQHSNNGVGSVGDAAVGKEATPGEATPGEATPGEATLTEMSTCMQSMTVSNDTQKRPPQWAVEAAMHADVASWFHVLVRAHFWGPLKPPFNERARAAAGFHPSWYLPLSQVEAGHPTAVSRVEKNSREASNHGGKAAQ